MSKIAVLIVDDEPLAREGVRQHLLIDPDIEIIGECSDGAGAVSAIRAKAPQLVFLDVQLPELDGFGVLEAVGTRLMPATVFVTAYDKYALRAFEVQAWDYLLKPFDDDRFCRALERAKSQIFRRADECRSQKLDALLESIRAYRKYPDRLAIKSAGRVFFINVEDIEWMDAADNYVQLHIGKQTHLFRSSITDMEGKLDPEKFLRIRHSTIVNLSRIKEIRTLFKGEYSVVLNSGAELVASRRFRKKIRGLLGDDGLGSV
jgi:two-component system LytT family response regulator